MFAPPPQLISLGISSVHADKLANFYNELGILFEINTDSNGDKVYHYQFDKFKFENFLVQSNEKASKNLKFRLIIDEVDGYLNAMVNKGAKILKEPWNSAEGRQAIIVDPEGHQVELLSKFKYIFLPIMYLRAAKRYCSVKEKKCN